MEEAEFGPGLPVHTVFIMGKLLAGNRNLEGLFFFLIYIYIYALLIFLIIRYKFNIFCNAKYEGCLDWVLH